MDDQYLSLESVLKGAMEQASDGKGKERHANENEHFEDQTICALRRAKLSFTAGQAVKKIIEARRLEDIKGKMEAIYELRGAIVYLAAEILVLEEEILNGESQSR